MRVVYQIWIHDYPGLGEHNDDEGDFLELETDELPPVILYGMEINLKNCPTLVLVEDSITKNGLASVRWSNTDENRMTLLVELEDGETGHDNTIPEETIKMMLENGWKFS